MSLIESSLERGLRELTLSVSQELDKSDSNPPYRPDFYGLR